MSTKQLRRLAQQQEAEKEIKESEDDEEEEDVPNQPRRINKFALLMEDDEENSDDKSEDEKEDKKLNIVKSAPKKSKKKKKKTKNEIKEILEEETESSVDKYSEIDGLKKIMNIQWPDLNSDNELKRVLGSGFKRQNEQRSGSKRTLPQYRIIQKDPRWPHVDGSGLSVVFDENFPNPQPGFKYYKFVHNSAYQEQQQLFWDLMDNQQPDLQVILQMNRFHLDTILILITQLIQHDDSREARTYIDFGIYICESVMPTGFEMLNPTHILSYDVRENRAFFLLLFWHLKLLIKRRYFFTALQVAKLILLKDPNDPLGMNLIIDSLAIKSGQYEFLVEYYDYFKNKNHLDKLPNMLYSLAIVNYLISAKNDDIDHEDIANDYLYESLSNYPGFLAAICEKMMIKPSSNVIKTLMIDEFDIISTPKGLKLLEQIYVYHNFEDVWKKEEIRNWIEITTEKLVEKNKKEFKNKISKARTMHKQIYLGMAEPVARHGNFFEIYPAESGIPATDPFPPVISRFGYNRRERIEIPIENQRNDEQFSIIGLFQGILRTLNPEYQAQEETEPELGPRDAPEAD